jgi:hypothetical protein
VSETALQPTIAAPRREISGWRGVARLVARGMTAIAVVAIVVQFLHVARLIEPGFPSWRPVALIVLLWFVAIDVAAYAVGGVRGQRILFLLPALKYTLSLYIYREGVESGNVGYATAMSMVFLIVVLVSVTALLVFASRRIRDVVY